MEILNNVNLSTNSTVNSKNILTAGAPVTATISTSWSGSSAPFTQTISVAGMTAASLVIVAPVYSTTNATALAQKDAWNMISKIETGAGNIVVTCFEEKPVTSIPIQLKEV